MNADVGRSAVSHPRLHYAWVVALVTLAVLLVTAGIRATPGILIIPLEREFGWSRTVISAAIAINTAGPSESELQKRTQLTTALSVGLSLANVSISICAFQVSTMSPGHQRNEGRRDLK